jgi:hypothetical protein
LKVEGLRSKVDALTTFNLQLSTFNFQLYRDNYQKNLKKDGVELLTKVSKASMIGLSTCAWRCCPLCFTAFSHETDRTVTGGADTTHYFMNKRDTGASLIPMRDGFRVCAVYVFTTYGRARSFGCACPPRRNRVGGTTDQRHTSRVGPLFPNDWGALTGKASRQTFNQGREPY